MRITTRLRIVSIATIALLVILAPVLIWAFIEFRTAKNDNVLANLIHKNFFERVSFRDQYFLYRENRVRAQWDKNKKASDDLLRAAKIQFHSEKDRQVVGRLDKAIENTAMIFHRIVNNTEALKTAAGNRNVYEELDKRLYSQLLLNAAEVRNSATALQNTSAARVEQAYKNLSIVAGLLAVSLALAIVLNAMQISGLIRRRLVSLHAGAKMVADGDLGHRIECDGVDEFAELAQSINNMTDKLQLFTQHLETLVAERTAELRKSESHLRAIIEAEPECIKIVDAQGRLTQMNPAGLAMIEADSLAQVAGKPMVDLIAPDYRDAFANLHKRVLVGESVQLEFEVLGLKGGRRWLETHAAPMQDHGETVQLAVTRDITERKQAEAKLRLAARVFTHAREGIMITGADGTILDVNETFTRITGYSRDETLGQNPRFLSSDRQDKEFYIAMWRDLVERGYWSGELWNRRKNGEVYPELLTVSAVLDAQGIVRQYVALFSDITVRKQMEDQIHQLAFFDPLTRLPNRRMLNDRLSQAMALSKRSARYGAVMVLDLDNFKPLNDKQGHLVGDLLLIEVARRMTSCVREVDTVARIGGDEFVVLLGELDTDRTESASQAQLIAEKIRVTLSAPYRLTLNKEGQVESTVEHRCYASIGAVLFVNHEASQEDLLKWADAAMYQAKDGGRNTLRFYEAKGQP